MSVHTYQNFNLLVTHEKDGQYLARVIDSPAGEAKVVFSLPFSARELEEALALSLPSRSLSLPESGATHKLDHKQIGNILYTHVFKDDVEDVLLRSLEIVKRKDQGLRIRLYLSDVPELINIPWEYLYDESTDKFFALSVYSPIVRYLELEDSFRDFSIAAPLNILVMISSPSDREPLDVEKEWKQLKGSLSGLEQQGQVSIKRLNNATLAELQSELRNKPYHIFHFIGHGDFDDAKGDGTLVLESSDGTSEMVSAKRFGTLLHDENSVLLAVLNACEGSKTSTVNPFAGVGQTLVRQGIPAVIAMHYEVTDKTAILFSRELYRLLAEGYPVDAALAEVRKSIFASSDMVEWGTPVLYLRIDSSDVIKTQATKTIDQKVVPAASRLEGTSLMLVSPNYFDDQVKISRHRLDKERMTKLFQQWMKERDKQWPQSITPELLIDTLKPVYLANFVVAADASANFKAQLGHTIDETSTCPACKGSGELIRENKHVHCARCDGTGSISKKIVKDWEPMIGNLNKSYHGDFRSYNREHDLQSFKPGIKSEAASKQLLLDDISPKEATTNSIIQTAVKSHQSFRQGVEQKLYKTIFDSAQWTSKHKADQVKDLELFNFECKFRDSYTWLYPIHVGSYTFKDETLTVLVDDLAGKLAVQKPKEVRKALLIKRLIIASAVVMCAVLVGYIYWTWKNTSGY